MIGARKAAFLCAAAEFNLEETSGTLIGHYDFNDTDTLTGGITVTAVTDKSSGGHDLAAYVGGLPWSSTGINGKGALVCTGSADARSLGNSDAFVPAFIVVVGGWTGLQPEFNGMVTTYTGASGGEWFTANSGTNNWYGSFTRTRDGVATQAIGASTVHVYTVETTGSNQGIAIGNDRQYVNRGWTGPVGEVLLYSSVPSSYHQSQLLSFLTSKWGLG